MAVDVTPDLAMMALWSLWLISWWIAAIWSDRSVKRSGTRHQLSSVEHHASPKPFEPVIIRLELQFARILVAKPVPRICGIRAAQLSHRRSRSQLMLSQRAYDAALQQRQTENPGRDEQPGLLSQTNCVWISKRRR